MNKMSFWDFLDKYVIIEHKYKDKNCKYYQYKKRNYTLLDTKESNRKKFIFNFYPRYHPKTPESLEKYLWSILMRFEPHYSPKINLHLILTKQKTKLYTIFKILNKSKCKTMVSL